MGNSSVLKSNQHIVIDLSSWYKVSLAPKIELIQSAIDRKEKIRFDYYGRRQHQRVELYLLVFSGLPGMSGDTASTGDYRMFR